MKRILYFFLCKYNSSCVFTLQAVRTDKKASSRTQPHRLKTMTISSICLAVRKITAYFLLAHRSSLFV
jgi:hypothetical protein